MMLVLLVLRECSGMVHWLTINNNPRNPIPIHSLRLAPVSDDDGDGDDDDDDGDDDDDDDHDDDDDDDDDM